MSLKIEDLLLEQGIITQQMGKTFLIDFEEQKFLYKDGKMIKSDATDSIRMWITKKILTERYKYKIYDKYGLIFREYVIGQRYPREYVNAILRDDIINGLLEHPKIKSIQNFNTEIKNRHHLYITFDVECEDFTTFKWEVYI